jgi:uncharacterized protein (TIGR02271 family)
MTMKNIIALYDDIETAHKAIRALRDAGGSQTDISLVAHDVEGRYGMHLGDKPTSKPDTSDGAATGAGLGAVLGGIGGLLVGLGALAIPGIGPVVAAGPLATAIAALVGAGAGAVAGGAAGGLLGALVDMGLPEEEAGWYAEGVRRGGALVVVRTDDTRVDQVRRLLNQFGPVDVKQRAAEWQQSGWKGFDVQAKPYATKQLDKERKQYRSRAGDGQREVVLPVVEERLVVGKREVESGGVRVDTHVTETPVEQQVNLREERVTVERRPVDRSVEGAMPDAFKEGSVEMRATSEEAVVQKRAKVTEEVVVRKDVDQHTETVRDTVRRTDVDVKQTGADMERYRSGWRGHYQTHFARTGNKYEHYEPAYQYGMNLRSDARYRDWDWARLEPEARRSWESRSPGTWEQIKDAVRYAWEDLKQRARD